MTAKTLELDGVDLVISNLVRFQKKYPKATAAAVFAEATRIFIKSQERVPVDTGRLRASGMVVPVGGRGFKFTTVIAYGTDYGLAVHERVERAGALYLEKPWKEAQGGIFQRILRDAGKFTKGGSNVPQPRKIGGGNGTEGSDST